MSREEILLYLKECIFDGELSDQNFYSKIINFLPKNVSWDAGVTKLVLTFPETDFVIKIPFNGESRTVYKKDDNGRDLLDENGDYIIDEEESSFLPFEGAFVKEEVDAWNYCQAELEMYQKAIEDEVEDFLLQIDIFAVINEHPIYFQKKADTFSSSRDWDNYDEDTVKDSRKKCREKEVKCFNAAWISDAFEFYNNEEQVCNFLAFATSWLEDLHSDNVGYVGNKPVIIDYGGFND